METPPERIALERAIDLIGGQTAMARALGLRSQGSIANWLRAGRCPPRHVLKIESVCGGAVKRHELRPDFYPLESGA
jgi:DNA-binding transcriptional regulator YdaS (Cro superfamily)